MAMLKMKKIREFPDKELDDKMREMKMELSRDMGASEIGTVKNPGRIRETRKTVARILTEKSRRQRKNTKPRGGKAK